MMEYSLNSRTRAVAFLKLGMQLRTSIAHAIEIEEYGVAADLGRIYFGLEDGCMTKGCACVPPSALSHFQHRDAMDLPQHPKN